MNDYLKRRANGEKAEEISLWKLLTILGMALGGTALAVAIKEKW